MSERYDLLIEHGVTEQIKRLRGKRRKAVMDFILSLQDDPFIKAKDAFDDRKGRYIEIHRLLGWQITCHIDHPVKEVKILEMTRIRSM